MSSALIPSMLPIVNTGTDTVTSNSCSNTNTNTINITNINNGCATCSDVSGTIAVKNESHAGSLYMTVKPTDGLTFATPQDKDYAAFLVHPVGGGKVQLQGCNGMVLDMYDLIYVKCAGRIRAGLSLGVALRPNGKICFTISGYDGQGENTYYLASAPEHPDYNGGIPVKQKEDDTCLFTIEKLPCHPPAWIIYNIALRTMDGRYVRAGSDGSLSCTSGVFDSQAQFIVKRTDQSSVNFQLVGNNGKWVNISNGDVQCKGATSAEGMTMKPFYLSHRKVQLYGYPLQKGIGALLSSQPGTVPGSLATTKKRDANCIFFVESH